MHLVAPVDGAGDGLVAVGEPVVAGEGFGRALGDEKRVGDVGLFDLDEREAAGEAGVVLDRLLEFLGRRRADDRELALAEGALQLRHRFVERARAEDLVGLVEEEDDLAIGAQRPRETIEAIRSASAPAGGGAGDELGRGELDDDARIVPLDEALGEAADDAGLADAGRPDEAGAVGVPLGEDVAELVDLGLTTDDDVEASLDGGEREVVCPSAARTGIVAASRASIA